MIDGDADDHDIGVVVAVEALHGLGDPVNMVDGLLMVLFELVISCGLRASPARACNSGMSLGGRSGVGK